FEYGAMGKPVISSDLPVIRELLRHNETAILFRPGDAGSLADAILYLINNPDIAQKIGKQLRIHILKEYTWRRNAERIMKIYEEIKRKRESL
ncbi:glycosyltransferase family 4 protein, partial [candidate division TA06 bacterium]|nr:glycosyltransferase family 4 protein [candidate division TA06 bacterium]